MSYYVDEEMNITIKDDVNEKPRFAERSFRPNTHQDKDILKILIETERKAANGALKSVGGLYPDDYFSESLRNDKFLIYSGLLPTKHNSDILYSLSIAIIRTDAIAHLSSNINFLSGRDSYFIDRVEIHLDNHVTGRSSDFDYMDQIRDKNIDKRIWESYKKFMKDTIFDNVLNIKPQEIVW